MRPLEVALAALLILALGLPRRWTAARIGTGLAMLPVGIFHVTAEGWRWQMVPIYAVGGIVLAVAGWQAVSPARDPEAPSPAIRIFGALGLALMVSIPIVVPVWHLPEPTGPFEIGTIETVLVDADRVDPYGPGTSARRLNVQFWYPAVPTGDGDPEPWLADASITGPAVADAFGFPTFALGHSDLITSHSYRQAAVAGDESFPVIVYSHGWTGLRSAGLDQIEELVSHGFVVVAPDHTYGAAATVFPSGELVTFDPSALPEWGTVPAEEYDRAALQLVATYASDLSFIIDELARLNEDAGWLLAGRFDLSRVGLFGHSTGGGAAISACAVDERCGAVVGLDPWVEPVPAEILESGLDTPLLAIRSEEWFAYDNDPVLQRFIGRSASADLLGLLGAGHQDFTVLPRFSTVSALLGVKGEIDSDRAAGIVDSYLVWFFDAELNGGPDVPSDPPFDEVCVGPC